MLATRISELVARRQLTFYPLTAFLIPTKIDFYFRIKRNIRLVNSCSETGAAAILRSPATIAMFSGANIVSAVSPDRCGMQCRGLALACSSGVRSKLNFGKVQ